MLERSILNLDYDFSTASDSVCPPTSRLPLFRSPFVITAVANNTAKEMKEEENVGNERRMDRTYSIVNNPPNLQSFLVSFSRKRRAN